MGEEAYEYGEIVNELRELKAEELKEVIDFIGYLKAKKRRKFLEVGEKADLLSVCGIVEGPSDLADQHDHYLYGWKKE